MTSTTFIRREINALEQRGVDIVRIALRHWPVELVDVEDISERKRTRYVLNDGAWPLMVAAVRTLITRPIRFARAFSLAWAMSRGAERPLFVHLIYLAEACRVEPWLRQEDVEHIHAHFGTNAAEVAMLVNTLGGPSWSFTVHGPEEFDKAPSLCLAEKIERAAFVVAVSSYGRSQLYRLIDHIHWPKVHVVHCGLDASHLESAVAPVSDPRRLVCVGRLCEQKGQLLLIDAARNLVAAGTDFRLVLVGDGELRADIEALIARDRLPVTITGWISNQGVCEEILAARALVLPSFAEGLPVVLMEAMALHRPVISTYIAGIPELVVSGQHGWLVAAGDVEALTRAMQGCLAAPADVVKRMGEEGHKRAADRHDAQKEGAKLLDLFRAGAGINELTTNR
jgi:colanic acid/amylovoran biosynthesis glycosyltransferase